MGTMVEFSVNNANDPGDWLIGEEIYISNPNGTKRCARCSSRTSMAVRSSATRPGASAAATTALHLGRGQPLRLPAVGRAVVPAGFGAGTSYNLTASSLVCNCDTTIAGIGRAKTAAIWYRAMDLYFTSSTTYPQARAATLQAAADLYGATSVEYQTVARAWSATAVN
jgi:hypothetical protein